MKHMKRSHDFNTTANPTDSKTLRASNIFLVTNVRQKYQDYCLKILKILNHLKGPKSLEKLRPTRQDRINFSMVDGGISTKNALQEANPTKSGEFRKRIDISKHPLVI